MWAQSLLTRPAQWTPDCSDSCGDTHFNEAPRSALTALTRLYKQIVFLPTGAPSNTLDLSHPQLLKTQSAKWHFFFFLLCSFPEFLGETLLLLQVRVDYFSSCNLSRLLWWDQQSFQRLPDKLAASDTCHSDTSVQTFMDNVASIIELFFFVMLEHWSCLDWRHAVNTLNTSNDNICRSFITPCRG